MSDAPLLASYRRRVRASEERVWENVLDWEHLPWLHRHAFASCERLAASREGWRARVRLAPGDPEQEILLELEALRSEGRYVARTLEGPGAGTEIWTRVRAAGPGETDVEVDFHVPGVAESSRAALGAGYQRLYARLWDEDEAMMRRRADVLSARLIRRAPEGSELRLGPAAALRKRAPFVLEAAGVPLRITALEGDLYAHSAVCPHWGGPLEEQDAGDPCVRCPWHGYRFDLRTGACAERPRLRLPAAPRVEIGADGSVALVAR